MSRTAKLSPTPSVPLKARITLPGTLIPADPDLARSAGAVAVAEEPGWFWTFATPSAAARIRESGLHRKGSATETVIPADDGTVPDPPPLTPGVPWVPR